MPTVEDYHIEGHSLEEIRNINELQVIAVMKDEIPKTDGFCACEICLEDVYAASLNMLPARYRHHSYVVSNTDLLPRKKVIEVVEDSIKRVIANPRHK